MTTDQTQLDPPTISREGRVKITVKQDPDNHAGKPADTKVVGFLGTIPERDGSGFITSRDSHDHRIRALDAYAFSLDCLKMLRDADVDFVLVRETDTGDVYEWKFEAIAFGDEVPDKFLDHPDDPQKYAPRESARAVWSNHGSSVIRNVKEDTFDEQGFQRASNLE